MTFFEQINFLFTDVSKLVGRNKYRVIVIIFSRAFVGIFVYRIERSLYLLLGKVYSYLRLIFMPLIYLAQAYSNLEIHYKAAIGPGINVFHPSMGVVISAYACIGKNLSLVGGNIIGIKKWTETDVFNIGDNCSLGANATIIGPLTIGTNVKVGANSCVTKSFADNLTLGRVPANDIKSKLNVFS